MINFENLDEIKLMRTVGANIELAKLCPNKNMKRFSEVVNSEDTEKSFITMMNVILICNKAAEDFEHFKMSTYEPQYVTKEELMFLSEDELGKLCVRALGQIEEDGKTTVEIEPIKNAETEEVKTESTSTTAG